MHLDNTIGTSTKSITSCDRFIIFFSIAYSHRRFWLNNLKN